MEIELRQLEALAREALPTARSAIWLGELLQLDSSRASCARHLSLAQIQNALAAARYAADTLDELARQAETVLGPSRARPPRGSSVATSEALTNSDIRNLGRIERE